MLHRAVAISVLFEAEPPRERETLERLGVARHVIERVRPANTRDVSCRMPPSAFLLRFATDGAREVVDAGDIGIVEAVKTMRKIAAKTQVEYARLVGVSPRILMELERGTGNPTLETLRKILRPFNLNVGVRRTPR